MSISITINAETAEEARREMALLLGNPAAAYNQWKKDDRTETPAALVVDEKKFLGEKVVQNDAGLSGDIGADLAPGTSFTSSELNGVAKNAEATYTKQTRERGKPSPGHARRTKAEIAEDEAAAQAEADPTSKEEYAEMAGISTGGERVGPEDDAATVEQDEADEADETAAAVEDRPADKKLTHDDVRSSLGAYVKLYGMAAAQEDGPKVIALALKNPEIVKVSAIPETQEALGAVVAGIDEMTRKNPFQRDKVA